jgi:hypothetical protein
VYYQQHQSVGECTGQRFWVLPQIMCKRTGGGTRNLKEISKKIILTDKAKLWSRIHIWVEYSIITCDNTVKKARIALVLGKWS